MNKRDVRKQPRTSPIPQKNPKTDPDDIEKIISALNQEYPAFHAIVRDLKNQAKPHTKIKLRTFKAELPKHLDRAIIAAETYSQRDLLCRRLSSHCYSTSKMFMSQQNYQQAHKWMTLSLSYLHLSMDPKKLQMDEKFEAELDQFEKDIAEAKKKRDQEWQQRYSQKSQGASETASPPKPTEESTAETQNKPTAP